LPECALDFDPCKTSQRDTCLVRHISNSLISDILFATTGLFKDVHQKKDGFIHVIRPTLKEEEALSFCCSVAERAIDAEYAW
jgi:hypothetical protein